MHLRTWQKHDIGLVIVDGHPFSYVATEALQGLGATQEYRVGVDIATPGSKKRVRQDLQLDTEGNDVLTKAWREDMSQGAAQRQKETYSAANDPHNDAMVWPCVHPGVRGVRTGRWRHAASRVQPSCVDRILVPQSVVVDLLDA